MIEIKNLCKRYGENCVYDNFNITLNDGEITCILGESGSGKTTLLNCIAGLTPYEGEITKAKCSYIFQSPRLVPNLTVYNNLRLICSDERKIKIIMEGLKISDNAGSYPVNLSGGQAQRVSIARAFLFDSNAILMDEPFSSLDLKIKNEIYDLFFRLWNEKKNVAVLVTHDVDEAVSLAHRIIILKSGKAVYDYRPQSQVPRSAQGGEVIRRELISKLLE